MATIQSWLLTSRFTLLPVLDLCRTDAVDQYEPPEWMRELGWSYQRNADGSYTWIDPFGGKYDVATSR